MHSFSMSIEKKNRANLGQVEGHNTRLHATASQLANKGAWFTPQGHHTIKRWDSKLIDQAKQLATRKDAVLAVEIAVQVGNQTDWRETPTADFPEGKPMDGKSARMNALMAGVKEAIEKEIGWGRVVSAALHTDESTPHVHVVFVPITDQGKLQAKEWLGGVAKCAAFRRSIWKHVNAHSPCEYTQGNPGGQPHDPSKAAGKPRAPGADQVARIQQLEQQVQTLFSQLKAEQKKARDLKAEYDDFTLKTAARLKAQQAELEQLRPKPQKQVQQPAKPAVIDLLKAPHPPAPSPRKRGPGEPGDRP